MAPPLHSRALGATLALALVATPAAAQMIEDGVSIAPRQLRASVEYGRDRWDEYWEGSLRRTNDNIGTLTTESVNVGLAYGATRRLALFAQLPYVRTEASDGVLASMSGRQDLTVAARYRFLRARVGGRASVGGFVVAGASAPTSDYTPDFLPLSIGLGSKKAFARLTGHVQDRSGAFVDASVGHAWRSNVTLDRAAYYTDGAFFQTDEVEMHDVQDFTAAVGYQKGRWCIPVGIAGQRTLGGGDIRRQDMPFVSNRMNFTRAHARVMYTLPVPTSVTLGVGAMQTLSGRNVGRSTTLMGGVTYAFGL
jgi:hypothetical protein